MYYETATHVCHFFPTSKFKKTPNQENINSNIQIFPTSIILNKDNLFQCLSNQMASATTKYGKEKHRRPKISTPDPKPSTHFLSHQSPIPKSIKSSQLCSTNESKNLLTKLPPKKNVFTLMAFRGLGCRGMSCPAVLPAAIRSEADRLERRRKKKKKKQSSTTAYKSVRGSPANVVFDVPEVCCTPPKIGFAYDVAPTGISYAQRTKRREGSHAARRAANLEHASPSALPFHLTSWSGTNVPDSRQYRRLCQLPEIMMLHNRSLVEGSLDQSGRFGDWRLNVDPMLYEELLELSDRIGYVGTGLREDEIVECLSKPKHSTRVSLSSIKPRNDDWKCSICQEECKGSDDLGSLACGHYHHMNCIKQWLLQKNECPLCKTAARSSK